MTNLTYPNLERDPAELFSQKTLELSTASLFSWRQAAGAFGGLFLHSCWGESSVLKRRYQGQTTHLYLPLMNGVLRMAERTGEGQWVRLAADIASNLLFLQTPDGGFMHGSAEFEPTYTSNESCPIHQNSPIVALLAYARSRHAQPLIRDAIRPAVEKALDQFQAYGWKRGKFWTQAEEARGLKSPLDFPGYCGVTNQDLTAVAAQALFGKVYGDFSRFEKNGKAVLDTYLSPRYYHERIGLFERGDRPNFVERTPYYAIIIAMLEIIHEATGDPRIPAVVENVVDKLSDAFFTGPDGLRHMAHGALTDSTDKSRVLGYNPRPSVVGAAFIPIFSRHARTTGSQRSAKSAADLTRTVAAYLYADGTIPGALGGTDPIFALVGVGMWDVLVEQMGETVKHPAVVEVPVVERSMSGIVWKSSARCWSIGKTGGPRLFAGHKREPSGIAIGAEESLAGVDLGELDRPKVVEVVKAWE